MEDVQEAFSTVVSTRAYYKHYLEQEDIERKARDAEPVPAEAAAEVDGGKGRGGKGRGRGRGNLRR